MKLEPELADQKTCCAMPKPCEGPRCMAWRKEYEIEYSESTYPRVPAPLRSIETGRGYCGLVYRN